MKNLVASAYLRMTNNTLHTLKGGDMGNFIVEIRKYDLTITTTSGDISVKARAGQRLYRLLRHFAEKNDIKPASSLCSIIYMVINTITADADAAKKMLDVVKVWSEKTLAKGGAKAGTVSDLDNDMALRGVKADVKRGEELASRQQKRKAQREAVKRLQRDAAGHFRRSVKTPEAGGGSRPDSETPEHV